MSVSRVSKRKQSSVFGDGFGTTQQKAVTLGQFRALTADLPDDTPLTYNDDGRSDQMIDIQAVAVERNTKRKATAIVFEA